MKYWFIIDDETRARSEVYAERLPEGSTREQAMDKALVIWDRKTPSEQARCDQLYIGCAEPDENSNDRVIIPDYDTMTDIEYVKQ